MTEPGRKLLRWLSRYLHRNDGPTMHELRSYAGTFLDIAEKLCLAAVPLLAFLAAAPLVYDAGFKPFYSLDDQTYDLWHITLIALEAVMIAAFLLSLRRPQHWRTRLFNVAMIALAHGMQLVCYRMTDAASGLPPGFPTMKVVLYAGTAVLFLTEISGLFRFIYLRGINPALLFLTSFFLFIAVGSLLLMLPNATHQGIRPIDAWFTAASAVCVTGLTVVDTAATFTPVGMVILLGLIQLGGLGIMTFAGLLAYLTSGSVSFRSQLALRDMIASNQISDAVAIVGRVVIVTLFFEGIGALMIFQTLGDVNFPDLRDKVFFAVFHSVSAFCNAGFSTYTNGLYELPVRYNYSLHLIIALLIVLGGLGFPIAFNLFSHIRVRVLKPVSQLLRRPLAGQAVHHLNTTSKLALTTTLLLLATGFVAYYFLESNASLTQHPSSWGKLVTSFFASVTVRTAGFNTVDLTVITLPTVMVYLLLMWIGASPGSTGGGIKTTVIAIAFLNMYAVARGKARPEVAHSEIGEQSVHRAFAVIILSLLIIGVTVLLLSILEPAQPLFALAFEAFSAFSTVGLTLGVTPDLSDGGKILVSMVMLVGRVGMLTILLAVITPSPPSPYRYPTDEILV